MLSNARAGGRCAVLLVCLLCTHATAIAAALPPDTTTRPTGPLTLDRALALASRFGPSLQASGLRADAARARIPDAGRRPNPTLSATDENFGGQLGGNRNEATLEVGQVFELGGDARARSGVAEAESNLAIAQIATAGRDALAEAADRFLAAWSLQARLARQREGESLTAQAIRAATERFQAGASPRLEILRAQSRATTQALERRRTESELAAARRELALSWGAASATFDSLVPPEPVTPADTAGWQRGIAAHPDLARASAVEALASARVRAADAARSPDLTLSGGVRRLEEVPGTGFLVGAEMPIRLWNRGHGEVAAAERERDAAAAERRATEQRLATSFAIAAERVRAAAAVVDTLRLSVRPAREQIVDELMRGYRTGRSSYLDLVAEQSSLLDTELALIDAQAELWRAELRFALLAGSGPLTPKEAR